MLEIFSWLTIFLLLAASLTLLLARDWRWQAGSLAAQYLALFILTLSHWPLGMAAAQLVTGWMAAAIFAMTRAPETESADFGWIFRLFLAVLILLMTFSAAVSLNDWLANAGLPLLFGALILIGMGLLQLGISSRAGRSALGLLTLLSGFEALFSPLENSILVAALLSVITLGLALAGAYLLQLSAEQP
ncbi:MAG: hypothetical protein OHK0031_17910 [Anaerolineales bacterium]